MDYKELVEKIDYCDVENVLQNIKDVINLDVSTEQKLYAIQTIEHESAIVFTYGLKKNIEKLKTANKLLLDENRILKKKLKATEPEKAKKKIIVVKKSQ